jgi:hypothetical protein
MRKVLLGMVAITGSFMLSTFDASAAPLGRAAGVHGMPARETATNVDYYWNHHHYHHRQWEHGHWHYWGG